MIDRVSQGLLLSVIVVSFIGCAPLGVLSAPEEPTATATSDRLTPTRPPTRHPTSIPRATLLPPRAPVWPTAAPTSTPAITPTLALVTSTAYSYQEETRGAVTLRYTTATVTYALGGKNPDEIAWQMSVLGPRDAIGGYVWFALTNPLYDWDYDCACTEAGCKPPGVMVNLTVWYTVPHWSEARMEHDALAAYWAYFESAVRFHEKGHGDIAATCGWQLGEAISALPAAATCEAFDASVSGATNPVYQGCRAAHRAYDDETAHGATQGVVWPPDDYD